MLSRLLRSSTLAAALCLLLTACNGQQVPSSTLPASPISPPLVTQDPSASQIPDGTLVYTNLYGDAVKAEVFARLSAAGIPQADVETISAWVDDYNSVMKDCPSFTLEPGFTELHAQVVDYGEYYDMSTAWFKTGGRDDGDPLCRVAAYRLMRSFISVGNTIPREQWQCQNENQWLYSDGDVLNTYALMDLTAEDQARYFTLWEPVPVRGCSNEGEIQQAILSQWQSYDINFRAGQVSLVTIWQQRDEFLASNHAAVLVEDEEGYLLFEKTNPESPYQATKFSSLEQIKQYMLDSLAHSLREYGIDDIGLCAVLRNDQLL